MDQKGEYSPKPKMNPKRPKGHVDILIDSIVGKDLLAGLINFKQDGKIICQSGKKLFQQLNQECNRPVR